MKRMIVALLLCIVTVCGSTATAFSYASPESYMGFSLSKDWYIFSKDETDAVLLDAVGLTAQEVREHLENSDCEYFITNPKENAEIYVKVQENALSKELFNILETEDQIIQDDIARILQDGFLMDGFLYDAEQVALTAYPQMKFITVPGSVHIDGKTYGLLFGGTFVNGAAISFTMRVDADVVTEQNIKTMQELASTVLFTVIEERNDASIEKAQNSEKPQTAAQYIAGGFGGMLLVALCLYFIGKIRKTERTEEDDEKQETD